MYSPAGATFRTSEQGIRYFLMRPLEQRLVNKCPPISLDREQLREVDEKCPSKVLLCIGGPSFFRGELTFEKTPLRK